MKSNRISLLAKISLLLVTVIWGSSFIVVKNTVDDFGPLTLITMRFGLSSVLISLICIPKFGKLTAEYIRNGAVIGFFLAVAYSLQTIGIKYTTPGNNAFLTAVYVVLVPLMYWPITKQKPGKKVFISAALCFVGIGYVCLSGGFDVNRGDVLTVGCGIMFAAHMIAVDRFGEGLDCVLLTVIQLAFAALFCGIAALVSEPDSSLDGITASSLLGLLYMTVFCTGVAYLVQLWAQRKIPAYSTSIIMSLEAVFGVLFSVIMHAEEARPATYIGFAIIFIAQLLSQINIKKQNIQKEKTTNE